MASWKAADCKWGLLRIWRDFQETRKLSVATVCVAFWVGLERGPGSKEVCTPAKDGDFTAKTEEPVGVGAPAGVCAKAHRGGGRQVQADSRERW